MINAKEAVIEKSIRILFYLCLFLLIASACLSCVLGINHVKISLPMGNKLIVFLGGIGFYGLLITGIITVIFNPQDFSLRKFMIFLIITVVAYVFINRYILEALPLTILSFFISAVYCVLFVRALVSRLRNGVSA